MGDDGKCVEYTWKLAPKYKSGQSEIERFLGWGESATLSLRLSWDHLMSQQPLGGDAGPWLWTHTLPIHSGPQACRHRWPRLLLCLGRGPPHSPIPFLLLPPLASVPTVPSAWNTPLRWSQSSFPHWCLSQQTQSLQRLHYMFLWQLTYFLSVLFFRV